MRPWRKRIQMVFQDPYASLNPRRSVYDTLDAALALHGERDRHARRARIAAMLDRVGLPARPPAATRTSSPADSASASASPAR